MPLISLSKLDKTEERVSELEDRSETCQLKKRKEEKTISKNWDGYEKCSIRNNENTRRKKNGIEYVK